MKNLLESSENLILCSNLNSDRRMTVSQDDYILRTFSKIQHKKWELYVITRIIHLLNDPELEFVCQQLIKTPQNNR